MNVEDFLRRLSLGPLSNLSMANEGNGTIAAAKIPAVISHLNDGLLALYSKFNLLEAELIIEQLETVTSYRLKSEYALTRALEFPANNHYIIDSVNRPFTDDLIKVLRVVADGGNDLPLNDDNNLDSVYTPSSHILQVPDPEHQKPLYIVYQAKHPLLADDALAAEIDIPEVLEEALLSFVAYKIFFYMTGQQNRITANDHLANYVQVLDRVVSEDLVSVAQSHTNSKFNDRGFC